MFSKIFTTAAALAATQVHGIEVGRLRDGKVGTLAETKSSWTSSFAQTSSGLLQRTDPTLPEHNQYFASDTYQAKTADVKMDELWGEI